MLKDLSLCLFSLYVVYDFCGWEVVMTIVMLWILCMACKLYVMCKNQENFAFELSYLMDCKSYCMSETSSFQRLVEKQDFWTLQAFFFHLHQCDNLENRVRSFIRTIEDEVDSPKFLAFVYFLYIYHMRCYEAKLFNLLRKTLKKEYFISMIIRALQSQDEDCQHWAINASVQVGGDYPKVVKRNKSQWISALNQFFDCILESNLGTSYFICVPAILVDPKRRLFRKQIRRLQMKADPSKRNLFERYFDSNFKASSDKYADDECGWKDCNEKKNKMFICNDCQSVLYCCREHQKRDRRRHKKMCKKISGSKASDFIYGQNF